MTRVLRKLMPLALVLAILLSVALPAACAAETTPKVASGFRFDRKTLVLYVGERYDMPSFLEPTVTGGTLDTSKITWKTSNSKVVSMNKKTGLAIGQKIGTATIKTNGGTLNMRKSMSTTATVLKRIPNRTTVDVLRVSGDWVQVVYGGKTGYVSAKYVQLNFSTAPTPTPAPTLPPWTTEPTPTVKPTLTPEPTPTAAPTPTAEPTPTAAPTPTAEPTPTAAPTPTAEPAPTETAAADE